MKTKLLLLSLVLITISSCSKKIDLFNSNLFTVTPSPLEVVNSKVSATINGRVPQDWFDKNYVLEVTPVLYDQNGKTASRSYTFQGESVYGNGTTINKKEGGTMKMQAEFDYTPAMKMSELYLEFNLTKNGKVVKNIPPLKIADGVISTENLAQATSTPASIAPDDFQKIIKEAHEADIMFLIQEANIRPNQTNSESVIEWQKKVIEADNDNRKNVSVEIASYASPDGGYTLNKNLAEQREKNTKSYLNKEFKDDKISPDVFTKYTAQDWEGFKRLVESSNLQDKNVILRVLEMYRDPETREREIKNISTIYLDLANTILPKLRRSRLIANVEIIGKTDSEIITDVNNGNYNALTINELLYAATLDGVNEKDIYTKVVSLYPNDYRAYNNLGVLAFDSGDLKSAEKYFDMALQKDASAPDINANLALLAINNNDFSKAEEFLGKSVGATRYNEIAGLYYIKKGDYAKAQSIFGDTKSNNAALAQLLNKNYNLALRTIQGVADKDATTYYIAAIIDARTNNTTGVVNNLIQARSKGIHLSEITQDLEFSKYLTNTEVMRQIGR